MFGTQPEGITNQPIDDLLRRSTWPGSWWRPPSAPARSNTYTQQLE